MTPLSPAAERVSRRLAALLGQDVPAPVAWDLRGTFVVRSKSRDKDYEMQHTPEGYAVHQGEGCESETFNGPLGCWHSKDFSVSREDVEDMTSVVPYESKVPERIDFTAEQLDTIAKVICVDQDGKVAPPQFVELFIAACRHTGLDPFLKQIYAMNMRGKWTMFVGVDGYRVISERTKLDQGMDGPQWSDDGREWFDFPPADGAATYCRVAIWRKGVPRAFIAVLPLSARIQPTSDSWKKDPNGMLAKCCEVLARRRAFPADMAVLDNTVEFDLTDGNAPITRAEVPEGAWRAIEAPIEHEDANQAPVSASDGSAVGRPGLGGDPASPPTSTTPDSPSPDANAGRVQIERLLLDCKDTWAPRDYGVLFNGLVTYMPDGVKTFDPKKVADKDVAPCLEHIRGARGELVGAAP